VNLAIVQGPAAFGTSLESRLAATRGLLGVCLTNQSLFVFSLLFSSSCSPSSVFYFFFFPSLIPLTTSNHHLISVSPAASALHGFL